MKIYITGIDTQKTEFKTLRNAVGLMVREKKRGNYNCDLEILAESAAELSRLTDNLPPRLLAHVRPTTDYQKISESPFRNREGQLTKAFKKASIKFHAKRIVPILAISRGYYFRQHIANRQLP